DDGRAHRADGRRRHRPRAGGRDRCRRPVARLPRARARRRLERLHVGVARRGAASGGGRRAAGGSPRRHQGPLLHRGSAQPGGVAHPRGLPAALHRHGGAPPAGGGRAHGGQDQPGRVRDGVLQRELRLRSRPEPVGSCARARRLLRRLGGRGRRGVGPVGDRHRHRGLDPSAGRPLRHRRAQADVRGDQPLRDDRVRLVARPGRHLHPRRHRRRPAAGRDGRCRRVRLDVARAARAGAPAECDRPARHPLRRAGGARRRRDRAGRDGDLRALARSGPRPRRHGGDHAPAACPARAGRVLPDRSGGVLEQPRALRRRALRAARRPRRRPGGHVQRHTRGGLRARGQAAHHARDLRAVVGLLRRLLRPRPEGPHQDRRGLRRRLRVLRLRRHADLSHRGVRARLEGRRPAVHVPERLLHRADVAGRHSRDLDSQRPGGGARRLGRAADRPADRRPGVQRERDPRHRLRARTRARLRRAPGPGGGM
ncbi:MAG: Aspartyl-tRNA(Asn) amidotransferase subunit A @ Glutamyl-tRNA(Gln) amidotransferase subunit A, partial [uncultured Solirubrobacteraceae bacterium]